MIKEEQITDLCWVYIMEDENQLFNIGLTGDLNQRIVDYQNHKMKVIDAIGSKLVYYRQFSDTLSALGFKLVLQQLSLTSLKLLIRENNPTLRNLNNHIECE
ncbi:MAG: hypothetical protein AB7S48_00095 [Bacteroidales bacterium]